MQKSEAFSILDPILLGGYTRYITDIRSKSRGPPFQPSNSATLRLHHARAAAVVPVEPVDIDTGPDAQHHWEDLPMGLLG